MRRGGTDAETLRRREHPGYLIAGERGSWQAVHLGSGAVLGPVRTLRRLDRAIGADGWARPAVTLGGLSVAIRPAGGAR